MFSVSAGAWPFPGGVETGASFVFVYLQIVSCLAMSSSPIRCRGPWKIHKRTSEPDRWLDEMGFFRKHTARDASCLFRAVSENIFNTQRYYHKVRYDCINFMASNRHLFEGVGYYTSFVVILLHVQILT